MVFIYQKVFPQDSLISVTSVIIIILFKLYTIKKKKTESRFPRVSNCLTKMLEKDFSLLSHFPSLLFALSFGGKGLVSEILIKRIQSTNIYECT